MKSLARCFVSLCLALSLSVSAYPRTITAEARAKIEKEHHEALVAKAKELLEERTSLERRIAEIDSDLATVESGKMPQGKVSPPSGSFVLTPTIATYSGSTFCTNGATVR